MSIYYPLEAEINSVITAAQQNDIVYLPNDTITSQIVINTNCTVIGQDNTIIDVRGRSVQDAVVITALSADVSNFDVLNDDQQDYTAIRAINSNATVYQINVVSSIGFKIENCFNASFESLVASNCDVGFQLINSYKNEFTSCQAHHNDIGLNIEGSSSEIGDAFAYQELGLSVLSTDIASLQNQLYYFKVNGTEFNITVTTTTTYQQLVDLINAISVFSTSYRASFINGDIRITQLNQGTISLTAGTTGPSLISSTETAVLYSLEENRTDRSHRNTFNSFLSFSNGIGTRLVNANTNIFEDSKVYDNTNIGIYQLTNSYSNKFRGEIYNNSNYGIRNSDKAGNLHDLDVMETWWGHLTGPSGSGPGQGNKVSAYVNYQNWSRTGTEPFIAYPKSRDWMWRMLGYPQTAVELTEEQVTDDIEVAVDKYLYYWTPEPKYIYLDIGTGQSEIMLPIDVPWKSVVEVIYQPNSDIFAQLSGSGESFFLTYYMNQSGGTFLSDFWVAMSYKETFERTLGIAPSYEFVVHEQNINLPYNAASNPYRDFVRLYPKPSSGSMKVGIKISRTPTEQEIDQEMWIRKYALTYAKEQLARIRGKFASVPGPTGEISMNAGELASEAQTEREALIKDLISRSEPLSFTTG